MMMRVSKKFLHLAVAAALFALLLACEKKSEEAAQPSAEGGIAAVDPKLSDAITTRVDKIIERVNERTEKAQETTKTGETIAWRQPKPRNVAMARGSYAPPAEMFAETPGEVVAEFDFGEMPEAILVDSAGLVLAADAVGVKSYGTGGAATVADWHVDTLQWNKDGSEVLLAGTARKAVLSWPDSKEVWSRPSPNAPKSEAEEFRGHLQFAPQGDGFWLLRDQVAFAASEEYRVIWSVFEVSRDGEKKELKGSPALASSIVTLPRIGKVWGHMLQPHELFPDPAPLFEFDPELECLSAARHFAGEEEAGHRAQMTKPGESVDVAPSADAKERVFFVRATRQVATDAGVQLGPSARAMWMSLRPGDSPKPITAEPTIAVAVSPDGEWVAALVVRIGKAALLRTKADEVVDRDLSGPLKQRQKFEENAAALVNELRFAFARTDQGKNVESGTMEAKLAAPADDALLKTMALALREAFKRHEDVELPNDFRALGILDGFLNEADGLIPEEPATILAIAAVYAESIASVADAEWILETATEDLSYSVSSITREEPDLSLVAHTPFYVARERIAGRLPLRPTAESLVRGTWYPIAFVENWEEDLTASVFAREARRCGVNPDTLGTAASPMEDIALKHPDCDLLNMMAESYAKQTQNASLGMAASLNRATTHPERPTNLVRAANGLYAVGLEADAGRLYDLALETGAHDLDALLGVASGYTTMGRLDEAEAVLKRAKAQDPNGLGKEVIEATEDLIRMLREK